MKKLSTLAFGMIFLLNLTNAQDCTQPSITQTTGEGTYCFGEEVTLTITGALNDATEWQWSTGESCGEQIIEDSNTTSITITVEDTITYFVRGIGDCVGEDATCTEIKIFLDNDPPEVNCPENINVANDEGECGTIVEYEAPTAIDNCNDEVTVELTEGLGSGAFFPVGINIETYLFTDSQGNMSSCSFTVTVEDTEPPVITCAPNIDVENDPGECGAVVTYEMPNAQDNCGVMDIVMTEGLGSGSMFPVGTTVETFTAIDAAGNESTCSISVAVRDTEPPVITLSKNLKTKWPPNHKAFEIMIDDYIESVTDNCPGVSIADVIIDEVSSDEEQNGKGDGNTEDDITMGDDCKTVHLLAERQGGGNGRVYAVHLALVDAHGNIGYETIMAKIPKSQGKNGDAIDDGAVYTVNGCDIELPEEVAEVDEDMNDDDYGEDGAVDDAMSISIDDENIETYPNPYQNTFSIKYSPKASDRISIELYNTAGMKIKRVFEGKVERSKIYQWSVELGDIKDKILLLIIKGSNNYSLRKIVKM